MGSYAGLKVNTPYIPPRSERGGQNPLESSVTDCISADELQYGGSVQRSGINLKWFGIEVLRASKRGAGLTPNAMCTSGWNGIAFTLRGAATMTQWGGGICSTAASKRIRAVRAHEFTSHQVTSTAAWELIIRFGARSNRHRMIEMNGSQVSSVLVEAIRGKERPQPPQVVVSSNDDGHDANHA